MQTYHILWADDEIDLLKPHILFLEKKGYQVTPVNNGHEAVEMCEKNYYDLIFLDENMPGLSGLEALAEIKTLRPNLPVVMITKSEEEHIMEDAIGAKISDYLIKPVNPNQILLSIKKILDKKRLVTEKTNLSYQQDFRNISLAFSETLDFEGWVEIYKKLTFWELEIENTENQSMKTVLEAQKSEANVNFAKFIEQHYQDWLEEDAPPQDAPLLSHQLLQKWVFPRLSEKQEKPLFFILIDNLRYDQWKILEPLLTEYFNVSEEKIYCSILPTTTAFARNAIFAGLLPSDIAEYYPDHWTDDNEEGGKNLYEADFLKFQMEDLGLEKIKSSYHKILKNQQGKELVDKFSHLLANKLNVLVYNFVDMLSHARTDTAFVRELAPDEAAYRSVTKSWFLHSPLWDMLRKIAEQGASLIITTDHGTIRTQRPYKIIGDRNTNTNLRYKQGKNLNYNPKNVFVAKNPDDFFLPKQNLSSTYVFATEDYFFAYPNNYNHYVKYYKDTFQHGGVSMEEMIIPFIELEPKK
ncbi:response regulator [Hugenholtzia roseola]|uniref:T9SS response regulator signal transducer PorX n=1 Tax=Hugenholtzia roseola TaxID=1002 RepID=UPI00041FA94E|nr:response regulator [Hugenholtzia roseola]